MFKLINGTKEENINKKKQINNKKIELYKKNYYSNLYNYDGNGTKEKTLFYGIKYISKFNIKSYLDNITNDICINYINRIFNKSINVNDIDNYLSFLNSDETKELYDIIHDTQKKEALKYFLDIRDITTLMASFTYRQFINIFPIIKDYSGHKYECKDYYTVMEYLNDKNLDDKIGIDNVDTFLWEYYNNDIMFFVVNETSNVDILRKLNGEPSLMKSFLKEQNLDKKIHTYTYHKDDNYMYDNLTGKTFKVSEPKPRKPKYLNAIDNKDNR